MLNLDTYHRKVLKTTLPYSAEARRRRRCSHVYPESHARAGERCGAYALWDSPGALDGSGLCAAHGGRPRGRDKWRGQYFCRTMPLCRCVAYAWPHRPGGGYCRWPEAPLYRVLIPPGTRSDARKPKGYVNATPETVRRVVRLG